MKKESRNLLKLLLLPALLVFGIFVSNSYADVNFGDGLGSKLIPNCSLRKEYNYFMNQWTTNEVCKPQVVNVLEGTTYNQNQNKNATGNIYLGNIPNSYNAPAPVNRTYYAGNNSGINYGGSANYLLSSFGTGSYYNSGYSYYPYTTSYYAGYSYPYYGYSYYPSSTYYDSVSYYTPSVSSRYYYSEDGGGGDSGGYSSYGYGGGGDSGGYTSGGGGDRGGYDEEIGGGGN